MKGEESNSSKELLNYANMIEFVREGASFIYLETTDEEKLFLLIEKYLGSSNQDITIIRLAWVSARNKGH